MLKKLIEETVVKVLLEGLDTTTEVSKDENSFYQSMVGKYVIVRDRNDGVNFGKLHTVCKDGVILEDAQRLHYMVPNDKKLAWYEGVAVSGLNEKSRISGKVEQKLIISDNFSLTLVSKTAVDQILGVKPHETSA